MDDVTVTSSSSDRCASQFGDGHCDGECDTEETQFDGFDCVHQAAAAAGDAGDGEAVPECDDDVSRRPAASRRTRCSLVYADGTCNHDCDSAACLWDGGDCIDTALR